jgi:dihydrofolate reductase
VAAEPTSFVVTSALAVSLIRRPTRDVADRDRLGDHASVSALLRTEFDTMPPDPTAMSREQRMVFGANTYRAFAQMLGSSTEESEARDAWVTRMRSLPATVVSTTLLEPLDWPDATVVSGDAIDVVARLKEESEVPLRSHGSLSMSRALMAAALVDLVQVTIFPVITGHTGLDPIFQDAADFDLELVESRTLDSHTQELTYRPTPH